MLRDCAHIQMNEAEWKNRKAKRHAAQYQHCSFPLFPQFFIQHKKPPFSFCVFILTNEKEGKNQILALNIKFMPYYNKIYIAS